MQRLPEIGIRIALGASRSSVFGGVVGRAASLAALGAALGCACAMAGGRVLQGLLFDTRPTDPATYALVVEDTTSEGQPSVIVDHTEQAFADAKAFNALSELSGGCGCNGVAGGSAAGMILVGFGLAIRRRRV